MTDRRRQLRSVQRAMRESGAGLFLFLLLAGDLGFMLLFVLYRRTPLLNSDLFHIGMDRSYPEMFQYLQTFAAALLLLAIARRRRVAAYLAWQPVFFYLLIDDAFQVHERLGGWLVRDLTLTRPLGLRLQDLGELLVTAARPRRWH